MDMNVRKNFMRFIALIAVLALAASLLAGCDERADENDYSKLVVATYGDEDIYLDEANFFARQNQYMYEMYYGSAYGKDFWTMDAGDGTMEASVKESVMQSVMQTRVLVSHAEEMGVSLTDEDKEKAAEYAKDFLSDQPESLRKVVTDNEERLTEICERNALANKVYEAMIADVDTEVSDEEAKQCTVQYVLIEDGNETYTDGEATAKEIIGKITKKKTIDKVVEDYTGLSVSSSSYTVNDEQYAEGGDDALGCLAVKMKTGDKDVVQVEGTGWYAVYCQSDNDEEATESEKDSIISERESTMFQEKYEELSKEKFKVDEDVWAKVSFADTPAYETETSEAETTDTDDSAGAESSSEGTEESTEDNDTKAQDNESAESQPTGDTQESAED